MANFQRMTSGRNLGLSSTPTMQGVEAAGQTFKAGALLIFSSGSLAIATSGDDLPTLGAIAGVACEAATGTTGNAVLFIPAIPGIEFEGTFDHAAGTEVSAQGDVGAKFGLTLDASSGFFFVDHDDTTDDRVVVTGFKDALGTTSSRCYFMFLPASSAFGVVAAN